MDGVESNVRPSARKPAAVSTIYPRIAGATRSLLQLRRRLIRPEHSQYRPDIDGLRAIAVAAVVAYHGYPGRLTGGFTGVDVFFVISGFLITGILVRRMEDRTFRLSGFYAARIRRLFPALLLVLAATLCAGWFSLLTRQFEALGQQVVAASAFASNLLSWTGSNYFDEASSLMNPLLHLWSLGVEEQFYLVWPLAIMAVATRGKVRWVAIVAAICSFALAFWLTTDYPRAAFYSPLARAWELMVGAILAGMPMRARGAWAHALSVLGLALLVIGFASIKASAFPGWEVIVPCLGTAMLIGAGPEGLANRVISTRPFVYIGLISYPIYLWHWPIFSISANLYGDVPRGLAKLGLIALSIGLAATTYHLVENNPSVRRRLSVKSLSAGMVLIAAAGLLTAVYGFPERQINKDPRWAFIGAYDNLHVNGLDSAYRLECDYRDPHSTAQRSNLDPSCTAPGTKGTLLLWGDSHAQALSFGIRSLLPPGYSLAQVATSGCGPSMEDARHLSRLCAASTRAAWAAIRRLHPSVVILAQANGHEAVDWAKFARRIRKAGGGRVVLVGPVPQWQPSLPRIVAFSHWDDGLARFTTGLNPAILETDRKLTQRYTGSRDLTYVSLVAKLCNASGCQAVIGPNRTLLVVDYGHLSPAGSVLVSRFLEPAIRLQGGHP